MLALDRQPLGQRAHRKRQTVVRGVGDLGSGEPVHEAVDEVVGGQKQPEARQRFEPRKPALDDKACLEKRMQEALEAAAARGGCKVGQSDPRIGWTYCSAMSQGKKIHVSWLTSVIQVSTWGLPEGFA